MTLTRRACTALLLATAVVAAGCAVRATALDAQWVNPQLASQGPVRSLMVFASLRDSTNRRVFEDRMVAALTAAGVKAVPSYLTVPLDRGLTQDELRAAVKQAGVTHAMVTRVLNTSTDVRVTPGMVMGPTWNSGWGPGFGPGWGPGWGGMSGFYGMGWGTAIPPQVTTTERVHADTRVFDTNNAEVLWSGATTTTTNYNTVTQIIDQAVALIVGALQADRVI